MLEYEKIIKENLNEILEDLFNQFQKASYNEREKLSKIVDKHILDLSKIDILPKNDIAVISDSKFLLFKFNEEGIGILKDSFEDKEKLLKESPDVIIAESDSFKFSYFSYVDGLDAILAHKFDFYINNDKLNIVPENSAFLITQEKKFYALNFASPWNAISKNCIGSDLPDIGINGIKPSNMAKVFNEVFHQSIFWLSANKFLAIENIMSLNSLDKNKIKTEIKNGPKQEKINELVKISLPPVSIDIPDDYNIVDKPYSKTFIQSYGANKAVIRWILKNKTTGDILEGFRIYVDGKNLYPCKNNNNGDFVYTSISNFKMDNFTSCEMSDFEEEDCNGTMLSYYSSIVKTIPTQYQSLIIFEFIKAPKIEQLFKMGFKTYFYNLLKNKEYELLKKFEEDFDVENPKEKNIYKYIGFNKYQFSLLENLFEKSFDNALAVIKLSKILFENFSNVDNKTTDEFFKIGESHFVKNFYAFCIRYDVEVKYFIKNSDMNVRKNFLTSVFKVAFFSQSYMELFFDYLRMLVVVDEIKFSVSFSDINDLMTKHDNIQKLIFLKKDEFTYKSFVKHLEKAKEFIFDDDEKYCVIAPTSPTDLITEGNMLHHCVGSFIDSVANGRTNIVFIREKSDINKPFFTAEISNTGEARQIHGFGNSNVSSVKDLPAFIRKWAKNKKLNIECIDSIRGAH